MRRRKGSKVFLTKPGLEQPAHVDRAFERREISPNRKRSKRFHKQGQYRVFSLTVYPTDFFFGWYFTWLNLFIVLTFDDFDNAKSTCRAGEA
jgi:hypothetical protein